MELLCWRPDFHKSSIVCGSLSTALFLQGKLDHSRKGLKLVHRPLQGPQPGLRPMCLNTQVGKMPLGPLAYGTGSNSSHRCFSLWIDATLLLYCYMIFNSWIGHWIISESFETRKRMKVESLRRQRRLKQNQN